MDNKGNKRILVELPFIDRLKLLFGSGVIIILIFLIFKYLFFYVWPFLLAYIIGSGTPCRKESAIIIWC